MKLLLKGCLVLAMLTLACVSFAATWDIVGDFPDDQGENGFVAQAYNPVSMAFRDLSDIGFQQFGTPEQPVNMPKAVVVYGEVVMLPAVNRSVYGTEWSVLTFVAPSDGVYDIVGNFYSWNPLGATTTGVIFVDDAAGSPLYSSPVTAGSAATFALMDVNLQASQAVHFAVNGGTSDESDNTGLCGCITQAVPEPGSLAVVFVGLAGLAGIRRRR